MDSRSGSKHTEKGVRRDGGNQNLERLCEQADDWLDENNKLKRGPGDGVRVGRATGGTPVKKQLSSLATRALKSAKSVQRNYL